MAGLATEAERHVIAGNLMSCNELPFGYAMKHASERRVILPNHLAWSVRMGFGDDEGPPRKRQSADKEKHGKRVARQHSEIQIAAKLLEAEDCLGITNARASRVMPARRIAAGLLRSRPMPVRCQVLSFLPNQKSSSRIRRLS